MDGTSGAASALSLGCQHMEFLPFAMVYPENNVLAFSDWLYQSSYTWHCSYRARISPVADKLAIVYNLSASQTGPGRSRAFFEGTPSVPVIPTSHWVLK